MAPADAARWGRDQADYHVVSEVDLALVE